MINVLVLLKGLWLRQLRIISSSHPLVEGEVTPQSNRPLRVQLHIRAYFWFYLLFQQMYP